MIFLQLQMKTNWKVFKVMVISLTFGFLHTPSCTH